MVRSRLVVEPLEARAVPAIVLPEQTGDFDRDGKTDYLYFETSTGSWWVDQTYPHDPAGTTEYVWAESPDGTPGEVQLIGNFDAVGTGDDLATFSAGTWSVYRSIDRSGFHDPNTWTTFGSKSGWTKHLVGDFTGDGRDDIANFHPSNNTWWVSVATGDGVNTPYGFTTSLWANFSDGPGWTTQLVADFTGDGQADIANYNAGNGTWWVSRSTGTGFLTVEWNRFSSPAGWTTQLAGDFNGDDNIDIASYNAENGSWWVGLQDGSRFYTYLWGQYSTTAGWQDHVVGDFDGDGQDDLAHFHPSNSTWWVSRSVTEETNTFFGRFITRLWADYADGPGWTTHRVVTGRGGDSDLTADILSLHEPTNQLWLNSSTGTRFFTTREPVN